MPLKYSKFHARYALHNLGILRYREFEWIYGGCVVLIRELIRGSLDFELIAEINLTDYRVVYNRLFVAFGYYLTFADNVRPFTNV